MTSKLLHLSDTSPASSQGCIACVCTLLIFFGRAPAHAQMPSLQPGSGASAILASMEPVSSSVQPELSLPDAPMPQPAGPADPQVRPLNSPPPPGSPENGGVAPRRSLVIPSNLRAQPLSAGDKARATVHDLYSVENIAAILISAGYSQVTNGQPNYGGDATAFGKRLGAAAVRDTTEEVFTNIVFAPLLHEDPRYYIKGPRYNVLHRTFYAITRPLITKTDSGNTTVNGALLLGYAGAIALTPAYYPSSNRNFHDGAASFGGSIGGAALGFFVSEFSDDVLRAVHLKRTP